MKKPEGGATTKVLRSSSEFSTTLSAELLDLLVCPVCKVAVTYTEDYLICPTCACEYPIRGAIPVMMSDRLPVRDEVQMNILTYERVAKMYEDLWEELQPWQVDERRKFAGYVGDGRVLDLGCGPGRDVHIFTTLGLRCVGADIAPSMLDLAAQRPHEFLVQLDMRHLAFRENIFDGVWACVSLIHLPREEIAGVLAEVRAILADGGIFFVSMQAGQGEDVVRKQIYENNPMFIAYYELGEFKKILDGSGFEVIETSLDAPWEDEVEKHKKFITFYTRVRK